MSTVEAITPTAATGVPPLVEGEVLSRKEYFQRGEAHPDQGRFERLNGRVFRMAPSTFDGHAAPANQLAGLLYVFEAATSGVSSGQAPTVILEDSDPEPDVVLFIDPDHGGNVSLNDRGYIVGGPELCIEVANTTAGVDLTTKKDLYEAAGVEEYVVWLSREQRAVVFRRESDRFVEVTSNEPVFRSRTFAGLWIDLAAIGRGDSAASLKTLQEGLATTEHEAFVNELARRKTESKASGDA